MKTRYNARRKGMTLAGVMIVIAVIAILAAMMMYSSTEAVATAKATTIIANLQILKRATIQWYVDNRDKVIMSTGNGVYAGTVKIDGKAQPIQQWSEDELQLGKYITGGSSTKFNLHYKTKSDSHTKNQNTNLQEGCYGICDGGTVRNASGAITAYHRSQWYVGYRFQKGEEAVRDKIKGMMNTAGVFLGTADAHKDTYNDNSAAVWMRVL